MTARRTHSLLELDDDLGLLIPESRRAAARKELQVEVHRLPSGPWSAARATDTNPEHVGLLLIEGVISREVVVADTISTELLGPGDVVRPWAVHAEATLLQLEIRWNALTESRVAMLDRRFAARLSQWPEVNSLLIDRINDRAQRLAVTQAISQMNRVDRRILALFWHLAERWGRMTGDGVLVPLTLSHRMLGQLVGARRPTISTAVAKLAEQDELLRRDNGTWLIKSEPVGVPYGDAERSVPIRRRLIAADRDELAAAVDPHANGEPGHHAELVSGTAHAELRATLARLRAESQAQVDSLRDAAERSRQVVQVSKERAQARERERESRLRRSEPHPSKPGV
jgi:CRP-like cAMP-binding protein